MQGQKAVVVLIIAMILTAGVGFFANVKQEDSTRTEYSLVGNLDAFMSANSSPTPQSELFNSAYNITGWSGDIDVTNALLGPNRTSQYVYKEESTEYESFDFEYNYGMHGYIMSGNYTGVAGLDSSWTSAFFKTSLSDSQNVYMYGPGALPNPQNPTPGYLYIKDSSNNLTLFEDGQSIGGYGQTTVFTSSESVPYTHNKSFSITFNGEDYSSNGFFFTDLEDILKIDTLWVVTADGDMAYDDEYAPMIYSSSSQAIIQESVYRSQYPDKSWNHRQMTYDDFSENTRIVLNQNNVKFAGQYSANYSHTITGTNPNFTVTSSLSVAGLVRDVAYLRYDHTTEHWNAYDSNNVRVWDSDKVCVYTTDSSNLSIQLQLQEYYKIPAVYFDPTRYMGITGTAVWSNYDSNHSLVNTAITMLWKGTGTIKLNNDGPTLDVIKTGNTYSIRVSQEEIVPIGTYKGLEITFRATTDSVSIRGIINEQTNEDDIPSAYDYIPSTVVYTAGYYDTDITDENTPTAPDTILKLTVTSTDGYGYILDTYILTDPNSLLWTDVNINLEEYFDQYKDGMRILFQGFVRYGDQITINGQNWDIVDSGFSVTVTEVITPAQGEPGDENYRPPVTKTYDVPFNMNGLAVDYYDGHCKLIQTNGRSSVDLGEISDYVIQMSGTWFFSTSLSTISVVPSKATVWNPGWDMDMNTTLLLFAGCTIFLSVIMMMRFRDMMGWEDIVILICSIVVPLVLVAV